MKIVPGIHRIGGNSMINAYPGRAGPGGVPMFFVKRPGGW